MAPRLRSLVDRELARVLDLAILPKEPDGSVEAAEPADVDDSDVGELRTLEAELAMLSAAEDVEEIGTALEPRQHRGRARVREQVGRPACLLDPRSGGRLVASGRIPPTRCRPRSKRTHKPKCKEPDGPGILR